MPKLKAKGYQAEQLVAQHYQDLGWRIEKQNWTIPGGEIDLVLQKGDELRFVEVKVVDAIQDLDHYLTPKKLVHLERSILAYTEKFDIEQEISLDVVFVQNNHILEIYENITN